METFFDAALDAIREAIRVKYGNNITSAAKAWNVKVPTLHSWVGDGKNRKKPRLESLASILDILEAKIYFPGQAGIIRRTDKTSKAEAVIDDPSLPRVPVLGCVGAGAECEIYDVEPDFFIHVPPEYYREKLVVFKVHGDSMEPEIRMGSYVGVVPFDGQLQEGRIYLVYLPPFGSVIKRIYMGEHGEVTLVSANPKYGKRILPIEEYEGLIRGQVIWSLQKMYY